MSGQLPPSQEASTGARLLVGVVGLCWGFNWVAARIILQVLPPWTLRFVGIGLGVAFEDPLDAPLGRILAATLVGAARYDRDAERGQQRRPPRPADHRVPPPVVVGWIGGLRGSRAPFRS